MHPQPGEILAHTDEHGRILEAFEIGPNGEHIPVDPADLEIDHDHLDTGDLEEELATLAYEVSRQSDELEKHLGRKLLASEVAYIAAHLNDQIVGGNTPNVFAAATAADSPVRDYDTTNSNDRADLIAQRVEEITRAEREAARHADPAEHPEPREHLARSEDRVDRVMHRLADIHSPHTED